MSRRLDPCTSFIVNVLAMIDDIIGLTAAAFVSSGIITFVMLVATTHT